MKYSILILEREKQNLEANIEAAEHIIKMLTPTSKTPLELKELAEYVVTLENNKAALKAVINQLNKYKENE